ncbi:MAG: YdcH family protein [Acidobacteriota bacterium]|nr:MAG: YdcH family protein [Acidobacteriota bacterium]
MDERAAKEYLLNHDNNFRQLAEQHQAFEKMLTEFTEKPFLTADEQMQETVIKKKKLALKDQMQILIERYQTEKTVN